MQSVRGEKVPSVLFCDTIRRVCEAAQGGGTILFHYAPTLTKLWGRLSCRSVYESVHKNAPRRSARVRGATITLWTGRDGVADSNRTALIEKWRRWKKRNRNFPLSVHPNGQWCKKVLGRVHCFDALEERQAALKSWNAKKDYLVAGVPPPAKVGGKTLADLCDEHMTDCLDRVEVGKLSRWSIKDARLARRMIDSANVGGVPLKALGPMHFAEIQKTIDRAGMRPRTQRNAYMSVMAVINWGVENEEIVMPARGTRFKAPTSIEIEVDNDIHGMLTIGDCSSISMDWRIARRRAVALCRHHSTG